MAILAPTIIVGDMNAVPGLANRGGQATPQDYAVRNTIDMLRLVVLTTILQGQPSHFPHQTETYATATPPPSSRQRPGTARSRWDPQAIGPYTLPHHPQPSPLSPGGCGQWLAAPPKKASTARQESLVPIPQGHRRCPAQPTGPHQPTHGHMHGHRRLPLQATASG